MKDDRRIKALIAKQQLGGISDEEFSELEGALRQSSEARMLYHRMCRLDTRLRKEAESLASSGMDEGRMLKFPDLKKLAPIAVAAVLALAAVNFSIWRFASGAQHVATLVSSEGAAWESALPTTPGSSLSPGTLELKTGVATIEFESGAEMILEAPAALAIESSMRARLLAGVAVVNAPESAKGFVVDTPTGYVVDHGTRFAVTVDRIEERSRFEVLEGEISVHLPDGGKEAYLSEQGQGAMVGNGDLIVFDALAEGEDIEIVDNILRIGTNGRASTAIVNDRRKRLSPDLLTVKKTRNGSWEHRSFFAFDISSVDLESVEEVHLRLNLVPRGFGLVSRLPKINRFGIYGMTNPAKADWKGDSLWAESPAPEDGVLLATFNVSRSQQRGSFRIGDEAILDFLKSNASGVATFVLVRETSQLEGDGPGLAHAFASDSHPEAAGPSLEFALAVDEL